MALSAPRANQAIRDLIGRMKRARNAAEGALARCDPNDDPDADRLTLLPLFALAVAVGVSAWMFLRWKYQPMQDFGLHVALAAVVADYGRPHSIYTAIYGPIDHLAANSLMTQLAAYLGRIIGVTTALRACLLVHVIGLPLATLYALRAFGRSPWGAVLAVPVTYNMLYVAGFISLMFSAPFALLSIVLFYRLMEAPTRRRALGVAIILALLFMTHVHMFLWTGFLLLWIALGFLVRDLSRSGISFRERAGAIGARIAAATAAVLPALLLFGRWYWHTFEDPQANAHPEGATAGWHDHFGMTFNGVHGMLDGLGAALGLYGSPTNDEFDDLLWLLLALAMGVALARSHRYRRPPVLELAFGLTAVSYFVLPEYLKGHDIIASRQLSIALWLAPAMVSPLPARVSRIGRGVVVALILIFTIRTLSTWHEHLVKFETEEVAGLEWVMEAAPPRLRIHYVKLDMGSAYFIWRPFGHVEKLYMGDKFGSSDDTPGFLATSFVRFREGVDVHRISDHSPDWPSNMEIWRNFDLVLTRRWRPVPAQEAAAERHGELLRKQGDWELWRSKEATPIATAP
jgi:hypothetical protein